MTHYDVIVAGVGGMGSAACYHLAKRGLRVLGLDRFDLGHTMGSSHGLTRIIRIAYFAGDHYVPMLQRAAELWHETGRAANTALMYVTGSLDIATPGDIMVEGSIASCRTHGLTHETLSANEITKRYPAFRLPPHFIGNWQPGGGFIASERAIRVHAGLAIRHGAELRFNEPVTSWRTTTAGGVEVTTGSTTYTAGQLVLTAGAWMPTLAPAIGATGTTPMKQAIGWFKTRRPDLFELGRLPAFILTVDGGSFYGLPLWEHPGFKLGGPHFGREDMDPDDPDRTPSPRQVALIRDCLGRYLPDAAGDPLTLKGCIYTVTPDEHFIIDRLPSAPQVLALSPCSGHGYKFCSVFGEITADLVQRGTTRFDIAPFALSRFDRQDGQITNATLAAT